MNRFVLEDEDIIILENEAQNDASKSVASEIDNSPKNEQSIEVVNGGPGSGNFGHQGRPGKVGGSASKGSASASVEDMSYEQLVERSQLRKRMRRMKIIDFNSDFESELRDAGFSDTEIKEFKVIVAAVQTERESKREKTRELRKKAKEGNGEYIEKVLDTISVERKDAVWLRNNCSPEMAKAFVDELDVAKKNGLDVDNIALTLNDAKATNGSMGVSPSGKYTLKISKQILRDAEETRATRERSGPNGNKWWTSEDIGGTFSHEFGHAMVGKICKGMGLPLETNIIKSVERYLVVKAKESLIGNSYKNRESWTSEQANKASSIRENKGNSYMSRYGAKNYAEMIAESFGNPEYSALTKEIVKIAKNPPSIEQMAKDWGVSVERLKG